MNAPIKVLAGRGELEEAERLARRSLEINRAAMGDRGRRTGVSHGLIDAAFDGLIEVTDPFFELWAEPGFVVAPTL